MGRDGSQPNDHGVGGPTITSRSTGTLYVVSVPIGHLDDITLRALATLRRVTIIAAENPRSTQALLAHHGITATVTSYGPLHLDEKIRLLLHRLAQGQNVALVADNGTPGIYDPGSQFVAAAHQAGIPVKTIPGPSTMTAAAAISGFSGDAIIFEGHLPSTNHRLAQHLSGLRKDRRTLVFCVDPCSLRRLLKILVKTLPTRQIAIAMDLTTSKETLSLGKPSELLRRIRPVPKDSAVTVVIEGYQVGSHTRTISRRVPRATRPRGGE
ncbi:MAG: 16S rRNA (cytidine(1402)-2'-O)-methyltransferase [Nitrospiraceae bacterium]